MRRDRLRTLLFLLVGAGAVVITLALYLAPRWKPVKSAFESTQVLEEKSIDARFKIRGAKDTPSDVVILGVDDTTFQDLQQRWPFTRNYHAQVINRLRKDGAKAIIYDVQFTEPQNTGRPNKDASDDNALLTACRRAGNCVMAATEFNNAGEAAVFGGPPGQKFARVKGGDGNFAEDSDGVIPKLFYERQRVKPLCVVGHEQETGKPVAAGDLGGDTTFIDWYGPAGTVKTIPFSRACAGCGSDSHGKPKKVAQAPPGFFKNKVVIVGPIAPTLQDIHDTPFDSLMPGAEVQANSFLTAREGFPLNDSSTWIDILLIVALGFVAPLASIRLRLWGIAVALGVGVLFALVAQYAFQHGTVLSFTYPLGALLLVAVGSLAVHYVTE